MNTRLTIIYINSVLVRIRSTRDLGGTTGSGHEIVILGKD